MIQVTLTFNSIAAAVAELSKIDPAALSATHATEVVDKAAAGKSAPAQSTAKAAAEAPPIDYALLKAAVFELSGKNQPKLAQIAGEFGVKTFKELAPARWGDALAAVKAALAPAAVEDEAFA